MTQKTVEIITFKLVENVSETEFLKASDVAGAFIAAKPGFVLRRLTKSSDGVYMDYVIWQTKDNATDAMTASMQEASLVPFIQSIDEKSMKIDHQTLISSMN